MSPRPLRAGRVSGLVALLLAMVLGLSLTVLSVAEAGSRHAPKPTVVFVHGAFADASGFSASIKNLQRRGFTVHAPANPLRGLQTDSDHLTSFLSTITGPVVLVGHSYGGAVITNAATGDPDVKALVYIAAFALDEGETGDLDQDGYINPATFREVFAADVPAAEAAVMAASQRPGTLSSLAAPSGVPAWRTIPSWYLVAKQDRAIPPEAERAMAVRAGAHTVEIDSSHVAMISHPGAVTALILAAVAGTSR